MLTKFCRSPFENKAATSEMPKFNGKTGQAFWRRKIIIYLHSRHPDMTKLLNWAEQQREPVTLTSLAVARRSHALQLTDDPEVLSYHLWGFLNASLIEDAWLVFSNVEIENGLEVWRSVVLATTQKTQVEVLRLEDGILQPDPVKHATDIEKAFVAWDASYREYLEAGGQAVSDYRKVGIFMRMLPESLKTDVIKDMGKFENQPEVLRRYLRERVQWLKWDDTPARKHHLLDGGAGDDGAEDDSDAGAELAILAQNGTVSDGQLAAFVRRQIAGGKRPWAAAQKGPKDRERPARSKADTTCPNCLEKGHTAQECTKPKIEVKDRRCFVCNEPGHSANRCPKGRLKALARESDPAPVRETGGRPAKYTLCLESEGGFVPAHRLARKTTPWAQAAAKLAPRGTTVNELMESAFTKYARLKASQSVNENEDATAAEPPPMPEALRDQCRALRGLRSKMCRASCCSSLLPKNKSTSATRPEPAGKASSGVWGAVAVPTEEPLRGETPSGQALNCFYGIDSADGSLNALEEPEFIETEMILDTGATTHAADRLDFPQHVVVESEGSKAGQRFGCAGGKMLENEGEVHIMMIAPGGLECELETTVQITKITRPLLSVTQMTRNGDIFVVCKKDEALVMNQQQQVLAVFKRKGGLYVANMKVRNPKYKPPFGGPAR